MNPAEVNMNMFVINDVMNVVTFMLVAWFGCMLFERKLNLFWTYFIAGFGLGVCAPMIQNYIPKHWSMLIAIALLLAYDILLFKGSVKSKLIGGLLSYTAINLTSVPAFYIALILNIPNPNVSALVYVAIFVLLCLSLMFMIIRTWQSISLVFSNVKFMSFFLLPLSQCIVTVLVIIFMSKNPSSGTDIGFGLASDKIAMLLFTAALALSFFADGLFIQSFGKLATSIRERERLEALENENRMTYEYVKGMETDIATMRRYRHDFVNIIGTVKYAVSNKDEKGIDSAVKMLDQMTQDSRSATGKVYCDCSIVNCMLAYEERKLENRGVACDFRIEIPEKLGVDELDLCRLLTNLMDNAAEACEQLEKDRRTIYTGMKYADGYLFVSVRNEKKLGAVSFNTTKKDKKSHGLGMEIIRSIVEHSGGTLDISETETEITVTASMKWAE